MVRRRTDNFEFNFVRPEVPNFSYGSRWILQRLENRPDNQKEFWSRVPDVFKYLIPKRKPELLVYTKNLETFLVSRPGRFISLERYERKNRRTVRRQPLTIEFSEKKP